MLTTILAAAAPKENPYGLIPALREGGLISQTVFGILVLMLFFSLYILFTKLFEQQKILNQAKRVRAGFWNANSLREGAAKLEKNSAYRQLVDDGLAAQEQHSKLTDPVEAHDWLHGSLARSEDLINSQLKSGLSFLATVGSTAPFIGLFGTVWGIMNSFQAIALTKNTSLAVVAPGIAEALFATALGLVAAIPAVVGFNKLSNDLGRYAGRLEAFAGEFGAILSRQLEERA